MGFNYIYLCLTNLKGMFGFILYLQNESALSQAHQGCWTVFLLPCFSLLSSYDLEAGVDAGSSRFVLTYFEP